MKKILSLFAFIALTVAMASFTIPSSPETNEKVFSSYEQAKQIGVEVTSEVNETAVVNVQTTLDGILQMPEDEVSTLVSTGILKQYLKDVAKASNVSTTAEYCTYSACYKHLIYGCVRLKTCTNGSIVSYPARESCPDPNGCK